MKFNIPRFLKNSLLSILVIFIILLLVKVFSFIPESGFAFMQRPDKIAIDGKGNICRAKMSRGGRKKKLNRGQKL